MSDHVREKHKGVEFDPVVATQGYDPFPMKSHSRYNGWGTYEELGSQADFDTWEWERCFKCGDEHRIGDPCDCRL